MFKHTTDAICIGIERGLVVRTHCMVCGSVGVGFLDVLNSRVLIAGPAAVAAAVAVAGVHMFVLSLRVVVFLFLWQSWLWLLLLSVL